MAFCSLGECSHELSSLSQLPVFTIVCPVNFILPIQVCISSVSHMQCHHLSPVYQLLPVPPLSHITPELLQALFHCKYPPDFVSAKPQNSVSLTYNFCFACQLSASSLPIKLSPYYFTSISPVSSTRCTEVLIDTFLDILEYFYIYIMSIHP